MHWVTSTNEVGGKEWRGGGGLHAIRVALRSLCGKSVEISLFGPINIGYESPIKGSAADKHVLKT